MHTCVKTTSLPKHVFPDTACVCICMRIYKPCRTLRCMSIGICIDAYMYTYMYVNICACMYMSTCICVFICIFLCICICMCICICICICICMCICGYEYVHACVRMYMRIYMYMYLYISLYTYIRTVFVCIDVKHAWRRYSGVLHRLALAAQGGIGGLQLPWGHGRYPAGRSHGVADCL